MKLIAKRLVGKVQDDVVLGAQVDDEGVGRLVSPARILVGRRADGAIHFGTTVCVRIQIRS